MDIECYTIDIDASFSKLFNLMDFNVSNAFFTKFSKRQSEKKLLGFRLYLFAISIFVLVLISLLIVMSEYKELILPGQNRIIIYAVLIYVLLNALLLIVRNVNDILGFTSKFLTHKSIIIKNESL